MNISAKTRSESLYPLIAFLVAVIAFFWAIDLLIFPAKTMVALGYAGWENLPYLIMPIVAAAFFFTGIVTANFMHLFLKDLKKNLEEEETHDQSC